MFIFPRLTPLLTSMCGLEHCLVYAVKKIDVQLTFPEEQVQNAAILVYSSEWTTFLRLFIIIYYLYYRLCSKKWPRCSQLYLLRPSLSRTTLFFKVRKERTHQETKNFASTQTVEGSSRGPGCLIFWVAKVLPSISELRNCPLFEKVG